jgi:hypothetical protein
MLQPRPQNPDELTRLLQAAAKRRRRAPLYIKLLFTAIALIPIGLTAWFFWPRAEPSRLEVTALDQVTLPDAPVELQARLEPVEDSPRPNLAGQALYFGKYEVPQRSELEKVTTDATGRAAVVWRLAASEQPVEFLVRYRGPKRQVAEDKGRIFTWPAEGTALLIVDANHALSDAGEDAWRKKNFAAIPALPGAAAALRQATEKGYKVVYLCPNATPSPLYKKLRGWLDRKDLPEEEQFPDGPVLGRLGPAEEDEAGWERKTLGTLSQQFRGKKVGVTRLIPTARLFQEAGLTTFVVGKAGEALPGISRINSWSELAARLP